MTYKIKKKDTLKKIAKKYSVKIEDIRNFNNLQEDFLKIGDEIIIPNAVIPISNLSKKRKRRTSKYIWIRTTDGKIIKHKAWIPTKRIRYTKINYGYFTHPMPGSTRTQGLHGRNAVDMAAPYGTAILAAHSGIIKKAHKYGYGGGYGKYLIIDHQDGVETLYAHLNKIIVNYGQKVIKGQVVGYEGSTGRSTGPHLHFEVHGKNNPF